LFTEQVQQHNVLPSHRFGREKICAEKAILMTVWYLSNCETFRQIADRFNVTKSSAHRIIEKIVKYIISIGKRFVKWPNNERKDVVRRGFKNITGINNVLGAIDGCHINIRRPSKAQHVYCNRKSEYSILLQGVCDHERRFTDIFCGEAGSLHDSRLLKRSSVYEKGVSGFLGNDVLLGDSAYPCLRWLIPPFRDTGHLTDNQKIDNSNVIFIVQCVVAATILHNICIDFNDSDVSYELVPQDDDDDEAIGYLQLMNTDMSKRNELFQEMFRN
jgi:hypothetical protein